MSNPVLKAVKILRTYDNAGKIAGVSGKAVMKWAKAGRLPRTEATGETQYIEKWVAADPRISKAQLLGTVFKRRRNGTNRLQA